MSKPSNEKKDSIGYWTNEVPPAKKLKRRPGEDLLQYAIRCQPKAESIHQQGCSYRSGKSAACSCPSSSYPKMVYFKEAA